MRDCNIDSQLIKQGLAVWVGECVCVCGIERVCVDSALFSFCTQIFELFQWRKKEPTRIRKAQVYIVEWTFVEFDLNLTKFEYIF